MASQCIDSEYTKKLFQTNGVRICFFRAVVLCLACSDHKLRKIVHKKPVLVVVIVTQLKAKRSKFVHYTYIYKILYIFKGLHCVQ